MASNKVYKFGQQFLEEEPQYLYKYVGYVPVGVLEMIHDRAGISESCVKAVKLILFYKCEYCSHC